MRYSYLFIYLWTIAETFAGSLSLEVEGYRGELELVAVSKETFEVKIVRKGNNEQQVVFRRLSTGPYVVAAYLSSSTLGYGTNCVGRLDILLASRTEAVRMKVPEKSCRVFAPENAPRLQTDGAVIVRLRSKHDNSVDPLLRWHAVLARGTKGFEGEIGPLLPGEYIAAFLVYDPAIKEEKEVAVQNVHVTAAAMVDGIRLDPQ